jgi:ATP-dependent helicase/nuclease subunit A
MAVKDLIALGRFVLLPEDDLTLATVLRGPLVGLSEEELFDLANDRPGSLWIALTIGAESGAPHLARAYAMLSDLIARACALPPYEFYSDVLNRLDGRRRLLTRLGPEAGDPIDEFLALALRFERMETPALETFLRWIEAAGAEAKRDHEHGRDEVRIMTVHGAKGLEANIVFLADTCSMPTARHDPKLVPAGSLLLWPVRKANDTAECEAGRNEARRARDEEYRRLLYVAMTRARDRLYVCGYETHRPLPRGAWYELIASALRPACAEVPLSFGEIGWRIIGKQQNPPADDLALRPAPIEAAAPPAWAHEKPAAEPSRVALAGPDILPAGDPGRVQIRRGPLLDALLRLLPDLAPEARDGAARQYLAAHARGLDAAEREAVVAFARLALADPDFAPALRPGSRAGAILTGPDSRVAGRVDRLAVGRSEALAVFYADPSESEPVLRRRIEACGAALQALYPERAVRCAALRMHEARLEPVPEA